MTSSMVFDDESGAIYFRLSKKEVAYSQKIDNLVIADYDSQGGVIGIDFIEGKEHMSDAHRFVHLAIQKTKGPFKGSPRSDSSA